MDDKSQRRGEPTEIADALSTADWSGVSIGNKALIKAAIEALRQPQQIPEGYALVPIEPTEEISWVVPAAWPMFVYLWINKDTQCS